MNALPEWADRWMPGTCGCGARLAYVGCYCGGHVTCSVSAINVERCPKAPVTVQETR